MLQETTTDWRSSLLAAREKRKENASKRSAANHPGAFRTALAPLHFHSSISFIALVDRAAKRRDVNRSTFVRRAVSLLVAYDLGMPIHQVLYETPCPGRWGRIQNSPGERDLGEDIEMWCPHPGCDGAHLRLP